MHAVSVVAPQQFRVGYNYARRPMTLFIRNGLAARSSGQAGRLIGKQRR
jgi:hypothetical protein